MATVLCRADKLEGLPTLRQANCTPTKKLPVGGYVAIVSLPHQNMVAGRWGGGRCGGMKTENGILLRQCLLSPF